MEVLAFLQTCVPNQASSWLPHSCAYFPQVSYGFFASVSRHSPSAVTGPVDSLPTASSASDPWFALECRPLPCLPVLPFRTVAGSCSLRQVVTAVWARRWDMKMNKPESLFSRTWAAWGNQLKEVCAGGCSRDRVWWVAFYVFPAVLKSCPAHPILVNSKTHCA